MFNLLILENNLEYLKEIINDIIGQMYEIKILNIATNAKEAINYIKNYSIDLVLLDLEILEDNEMSGLKTIIERKNRTSIIGVTNNKQKMDELIDNSLFIDVYEKKENMKEIYYKNK